jgi:hypothetical protein
METPTPRRSPGGRGVRSRRPESAARPLGRPDSAASSSLAHDDRSNIAVPLLALAVPISSIEIHPNNPRVGNVDAIAASLSRFGQLKPLVVQESTGRVVAGNHVLRAARSLGWTRIAANVVDIDDATATAYLVGDNRTSDLGGYDERLLAAILSEEQAADNLAATGYDIDDINAIVAAAGLAERRDVDACPEPPVPTDRYVRSGETWALGRHLLRVGDATNAEDVRRLLDGATVDLVWTDPPYGVNYAGKTPAALTIENDDLGEAGTRQLVAEALKLVPLRPGGVFYIAAPAGPLHLAFLLAIGDAGLAVHQTLVWVKNQFVLGHADYHARHELLLYGWRAGAAHHFVPDRTQDTV